MPSLTFCTPAPLSPSLSPILSPALSFRRLPGFQFRPDRPRIMPSRTDPHATVSAPWPPPSAPKPWLADLTAYRKQYARSLADPPAFWRAIADTFEWRDASPSDVVLDFNFDPTHTPVSVKFLPHRRTNVCYNALDRWLEEPGMAEKVALYCEGNMQGDANVVSFAQLADEVQRFANVLRSLGVGKGDVVVLYMPMIPELPAAMLACARIGAVHSVVFGGFSAEALAGRIVDSRATVVVVAQSVGRGEKTVHLKRISDEALHIAQTAGHSVLHQVVTGVSEGDACLVEGRDLSWQSALAKAQPTCPVEWVESEHPLFILYTSGSTGKPKGVVHSTGGYMVYTATTFKYTFDYHAGDVFFSTSDCGWITGHSYVTYGPLLNGATQVLFEGVPNFPTAGRLWEIVEKYNVTQLYTAPTVIRSLKGAAPPPATAECPHPTADDWVLQTDRTSLRVLGSVGEPINPEAWCWYFDVAGDRRCTVVDTWWQTETGGHCLTPLPIPELELKPGCAMMPFFGIEPAILDTDGRELAGECEGILVLKKAWPSTLRTVFGDHKRMEETYFERFPGYYMTGDGARRDRDGHYWLTGRVDDILNVSGHRVGTAEVESALVMHESVAEAAVVGVSHSVKGESIYAYVSLMAGVQPSEELKQGIRLCVRKEIGPFASPDTVHWASALPKTRSGKIMRRILRRIAALGPATIKDELGDTSTLTDPAVVDALIETHGH